MSSDRIKRLEEEKLSMPISVFLDDILTTIGYIEEDDTTLGIMNSYEKEFGSLKNAVIYFDNSFESLDKALRVFYDDSNRIFPQFLKYAGYFSCIGSSVKDIRKHLEIK